MISLQSSHAHTHKLEELEQKVVDLKQELNATLNDLDKMKATLEFKDEELARKSDELTQLNNKVKVSILNHIKRNILGW